MGSELISHKGDLVAHWPDGRPVIYAIYNWPRVSAFSVKDKQDARNQITDAIDSWAHHPDIRMRISAGTRKSPDGGWIAVTDRNDVSIKHTDGKDVRIFSTDAWNHDDAHVQVISDGIELLESNLGDRKFKVTHAVRCTDGALFSRVCQWHVLYEII